MAETILCVAAPGYKRILNGRKYVDAILKGVTLGFRLLLVGAAASLAPAQTPGLLDVLSDELQRNMRVLSEKADPKPYFISYSVTDQDSYTVSASLGSLLQSGSHRLRTLDVSVRVGSPQLDNYHRGRGERPRFHQVVLISTEDVPNAIRQRAWMETDRAYRQAAERFIRLKTDTQVKAEAEDKSGDFSVEEASQYTESPQSFRFPAEEWNGRVRKLSAEFAKYPFVLNSQISVTAERAMKSFVSTEGSKIQQGRGFARVILTAIAKSPVDGMELPLFESFEAEDAARLPGDDVLLKTIQNMAERLKRLSAAREVDPFVGPAVLSGRAAGVFFHEIFGHRIEGHRQKDESEGQTFTKSVDKKVLPDFLTVYSDPTRKTAEGVDLNGWYAYDDEGIKARNVTVVEKGILKTFLMSRSPISGFAHSNGHGRASSGASPVSRQSNLIVESAKQVSDSQLRAMLIEEIRKQGKPYGLYFDTVTGGYTTTGRQGLQAFTVTPLVVYQVYPDGRPDELVRGVDIVGTPLASFEKILATSSKREVFNGICGAESGPVPVSAVAPALLVSEIEVQRKPKGMDRPPILPRPEIVEGAK